MRRNRPGWDSYWMKFAMAAADRATCSRLQVGAVIVAGNKILSSGYNGADSKVEHCEHWDDGACEVAIHAEVNALRNIFIPPFEAGTGIDIPQTMYVTHAPCIKCAHLIIGYDIKKVIYWTSYKSREGVEEIKGAGIEVLQLTDPIYKDI